MTRYKTPLIDWEAQWALHAPGFQNGFLEVKVADITFKMKPGPGFGNLSHPTTCLMLELMPALIPGKIVLDIGTGSGILALAACALGAKAVMACDIDPFAIEHAQENASLNNFTLNFDCKTPPEVTLLNMIWSEQKQALASLPHIKGLLLTSGLLQEQEKEYLHYAKENGWKLLTKKEKEGWLAFLFEMEQ